MVDFLECVVDFKCPSWHELLLLHSIGPSHSGRLRFMFIPILPNCNYLTRGRKASTFVMSVFSKSYEHKLMQFLKGVWDGPLNWVAG